MYPFHLCRPALSWGILIPVSANCRNFAQFRRCEFSVFLTRLKPAGIYQFQYRFFIILVLFLGAEHLLDCIIYWLEYLFWCCKDFVYRSLTRLIFDDYCVGVYGNQMPSFALNMW